MRPAGTSALLLAAFLMSGCFQQEAPRQDTSPAAMAESAAQRAMTLRSPAEPPQGAPETVAQLESLLNEATDPDVRREAVYMIADAGEPDAAAIIGQSLYDPDSQVRIAAVEVLTGMGGESSADWMLIALGDPDPRVRRAAVEALGEIGGYTARSLLQQSVVDADESVRNVAQQMLAEPEFAEREFR
jgi:HEAT repeat protein